MTKSEIITTTITHDAAYYDYSGQYQSSYSFKTFGKFTETFISKKCEYWYSKWDAIASEAPETLGITVKEWHEKGQRAYRMFQAWRKREVEYTIYND